MPVELDDERGTLDRLDASLSSARPRACSPAAAWAVAAGLSIRSLAARKSRRMPNRLERAA